MGRAQRDKGKRGEREAAALLHNLFGIDARRSSQVVGTKDSPDLLHSVKGLHIEVKFREKLSVYAAIEQAEADADDNIPILLFRSSRKRWLAICYLDDMPFVCKVLANAYDIKKSKDSKLSMPQTPAD